MVTCQGCGYSLIGERQKGHVYYRCHKRTCSTRAVREEVIDSAIQQALAHLRFEGDETRYIEYWFKQARPEQERIHRQALEECRLQLDQIRSRVGRLTDAYIDGGVDRELFEERKASLLLEEAGAKDKLRHLEGGYQETLTKLEKFLELAKRASDVYKTANVEEKRRLLKEFSSNLTVTQKTPIITLKNAPRLLVERVLHTSGSPRRSKRRTWEIILKKLQEQFSREANELD
jgi:hypothetical protein